jgi:hypothetical protein
MAKSQEVKSFDDKKYVQNKNFHDSLGQCFSDLKYEKFGRGGWTNPVEAMNGVTMKTVGNRMTLVYHRFVTRNK